MKKLISLLLTLSLSAAAALPARAADLTVRTAQTSGYYPGTSYESRYDEAYRYGGTNRIDYDIPDLRYGIASELSDLSTSAAYPVITRYGLPPAGQEAYPSAVSTEPAAVGYTKTVTAGDLLQKDGSIGSVSVPSVGLSAKVFEGTSAAVMLKGAGHYTGTSLWNGNVALFGHNRGANCAYFGALKNVRTGDTVRYTTVLGTRTYQVTDKRTISSTDYSCLNGSGDNRLTLITCVADQPSLRLCVQAVELK